MKPQYNRNSYTGSHVFMGRLMKSLMGKFKHPKNLLAKFSMNLEISICYSSALKILHEIVV